MPHQRAPQALYQPPGAPQRPSSIWPSLEAVVEAWWAGLVCRLGAGSWAVLFLALWWVSLGLLFALRFVQPGAARAG